MQFYEELTAGNFGVTVSWKYLYSMSTKIWIRLTSSINRFEFRIESRSLPGSMLVINKVVLLQYEFINHINHKDESSVDETKFMGSSYFAYAENRVEQN